MKRLSQTGFTWLAGLLAVIAVAFILVVGVAVLAANQSKPKQNNQSAAQQKTDEEYTSFPQLGVKIKNSDKLKGINFTEDVGSTSENGVHNPIVIYSTAALIKEYKACINRNPNQFSNPTAAQLLADASKFGGIINSREGDFKRDHPPATASTDHLIKQFNSFYLYYSPLEAPVCNNPDGTPDTVIDNTLKQLRDTVVPPFQKAIELDPNA